MGALFLLLLLTRHNAMDLREASRLSALLLVICAAGMVTCGIVGDRIALRRPAWLPALGAVYGFIPAPLFAVAFALAPGFAQLLFLGGTMFFVAGIIGLTGARRSERSP